MKVLPTSSRSRNRMDDDRAFLSPSHTSGNASSYSATPVNMFVIEEIFGPLGSRDQNSQHLLPGD